MLLSAMSLYLCLCILLVPFAAMRLADAYPVETTALASK